MYLDCLDGSCGVIRPGLRSRVGHVGAKGVNIIFGASHSNKIPIGVPSSVHNDDTFRASLTSELLEP